jgi:hypothetical protein
MKAPTSGLKRRRRQQKKLAIGFVFLLFALYAVFVFAPRHREAQVSCAFDYCLPPGAVMQVHTIYSGPIAVQTTCELVGPAIAEPGQTKDRARCRVSTRRFMNQEFKISYFEYDSKLAPWSWRDYLL